MIRSGEPRTLRVQLPEGLPRSTAELIRLETPEIETATGHAVVDSTEADLALRWIVDPGAAAASVRRVTDGYEATVRSLDEVTESLSLLHGLSGYADATPAPGATDAIDRLDTSLRGSFAGAHLRRIDWDGLRLRHEPRVRESSDPLPAVQAWLAELGDVHTAARSGAAASASPYVVSATTGGVRMMRVPPGTAAFAVGVRAGWMLPDEDGGGWWRRCGAPAHVRGLLAGRRLASAPAGTSREFVAVSPEGHRVAWQEQYAPVVPSLRWTRLSRTVGLVTVDGWTTGVVEALDAALDALRACSAIVLDLRGNVGGNLVAAVEARRRFLRERTVCGTIRYTDGHGGLGAPYSIVAEPSDEPRWGGELVVLTDALTASASEDFLLGLHGLPHVRVAGAPTAGGSGRPLTRRLMDDVHASISTALTYDRRGSCLEGTGIAPDLPCDPFDEHGLRASALSLLA